MKKQPFLAVPWHYLIPVPDVPLYCEILYQRIYALKLCCKPPTELVTPQSRDSTKVASCNSNERFFCIKTKFIHLFCLFLPLCFSGLICDMEQFSRNTVLTRVVNLSTGLYVLMVINKYTHYEPACIGSSFTSAISVTAVTENTAGCSGSVMLLSRRTRVSSRPRWRLSTRSRKKGARMSIFRDALKMPRWYKVI